MSFRDGHTNAITTTKCSTLPLKTVLAVGGPPTPRDSKKGPPLDLTKFDDYIFLKIAYESGPETLWNLCRALEHIKDPTTGKETNFCEENDIWLKFAKMMHYNLELVDPANYVNAYSAFGKCTTEQIRALHKESKSITDKAFDIETKIPYPHILRYLKRLPESVTYIGEAAFRGCKSLNLNELPKGLTSIGNYAFEDCTSLELEKLPDGLTSIGDYAFADCTSLKLEKLPDGLTSISQGAFSGCQSLALHKLPDRVTRIGKLAFESCKSLHLKKLPDGLTVIRPYTFARCTALRLEGLSGEEHIGELPGRLTRIEKGAFLECTSLKLLKLPYGLIEIGDGAFQGCKSLQLPNLPDSVTHIGNSAFKGCSELKPDVVRKIFKTNWGAFT